MNKYIVSGENCFGKWNVTRPNKEVADRFAAVQRNTGNDNVTVKEITDQEYWHERCRTCATRFDCPDYYDDIWIPDCENYSKEEVKQDDRGS